MPTPSRKEELIADNPLGKNHETVPLVEAPRGVEEQFIREVGQCFSDLGGLVVVTLDRFADGVQSVIDVAKTNVRRVRLSGLPRGPAQQGAGVYCGVGTEVFRFLTTDK